MSAKLIAALDFEVRLGGTSHVFKEGDVVSGVLPSDLLESMLKTGTITKESKTTKKKEK